MRLKRCKTYKKRCRDNEKKEVKYEEIHEGGVEQQEQGNEVHEEEVLAQKVSQEEV